MISIIDNIISTTGWSASGGAYIHGLTGMSSFSAGNNDTSLIVKLDGIGSYVEKTYSKDISDYDEIILWKKAVINCLYTTNNEKYIDLLNFQID